MKCKILLLFTCTLFSFLTAGLDLELIVHNDNKDSVCLCYCSDKCDVRKSDKEGDAPFFDKETGVCFCQMRDKLNYLPNRCHLVPKLHTITCCVGNSS